LLLWYHIMSDTLLGSECKRWALSLWVNLLGPACKRLALWLLLLLLLLPMELLP
jgi:hypothetical protein